MKRWIIFLGRGGTVLVAIGFALLLVSFFPSAQLISTGGSGLIIRKMFETPFERVLTPQQGLEITITADGTLTVYILEVSSQTIYNWIGDYNNSITGLEEFLEANPDSIGVQKEMSEGEIEYIPTKVTNATLILSNPGSDHITWEFEVSITAILAPGTKVRNLAQWTIPIGFVLALPWLAQLWKERSTHLSEKDTFRHTTP